MKLGSLVYGEIPLTRRCERALLGVRWRRSGSLNEPPKEERMSRSTGLGAIALSLALGLSACATSGDVDRLNAKIDDLAKRMDERTAAAEQRAAAAEQKAEMAASQAQAAAGQADAAARKSEAIFNKSVSKGGVH
jgi:hypothetical protein